MSTSNLAINGRQWLAIACVAIVPGQLLWFAMLYPLVPRGIAGWTFAAGTGVVVTLWAVSSTAVIVWLGKQSKHRLLCNALGFVVALSLGVGLFALALYRHDLVADHFSHFGK